MRILKNSIFRVTTFALFLSIGVFQMASCTKEKEVEVEVEVIVKDTVSYDDVCPLRGEYVGTSTRTGGTSFNIIYAFRDNNFVVGREVVSGPGVSFGGFRNTCDSVIWDVNYATNGSYYLLKGKFSNNRNTISGTFQNLNTPADQGTFTMSK